MGIFIEHHRRSIRMKGFDYSESGVYFITMCTIDRVRFFGNIENGEMKLSEYGKIVEEEWQKTAVVRKNVELDEFVIMPDHVHGIIWLNENNVRNAQNMGAMKNNVGVTRRVAPTDNVPASVSVNDVFYQTERPNGPKPNSIGAITAQFKSVVTKRIHAIQQFHCPVWQRNYYERIIRTESELFAIRKYIRENPMNWGTGDEILEH